MHQITRHSSTDIPECPGHRGDSCKNEERPEYKVERFKQRLKHHEEGVVPD